MRIIHSGLGWLKWGSTSISLPYERCRRSRVGETLHCKSLVTRCPEIYKSRSVYYLGVKHHPYERSSTFLPPTFAWVENRLGYHRRNLDCLKVGPVPTSTNIIRDSEIPTRREIFWYHVITYVNYLSRKNKLLVYFKLALAPPGTFTHNATQKCTGKRGKFRLA